MDERCMMRYKKLWQTQRKESSPTRKCAAAVQVAETSGKHGPETFWQSGANATFPNEVNNQVPRSPDAGHGGTQFINYTWTLWVTANASTNALGANESDWAFIIWGSHQEAGSRNQTSTRNNIIRHNYCCRNWYLIVWSPERWRDSLSGYINLLLATDSSVSINQTYLS